MDEGWLTLEGTTFHLRYDDVEVATEAIKLAGPWNVMVALGIFTTQARGAVIEYDDLTCDRP